MDSDFDDVLNCDIEKINIDGYELHFRVHSAEYNSIIDQKQQGSNNYLKHYDTEDIWEDCCDTDDIDFIANDDGTFSVEMNIPKILHGSIIGLKGAVRRKLESETKSTIQVPLKTENGPIVITAPIPNSIVKCKNRIEMILMDTRFKQQFTHFISIPMNGNSIKDGFLKFKNKVLNLGAICGVDETIFQNVNKLHLTICTLVLGDEEVTKAANSLLNLKGGIIEQLMQNLGPLRIQAKGLEYMNDDPSEVDVLYAKVQFENDTNNLLQQLCDEIVDYLADEGLTFKKYDQVKLHMTVMNTLFRKDKEGVKYNVENEYDRKFHRDRETFDASKILEQFQDWNFGVQEFNELHISVRKSTSRNNYYKSAYVQEF